MTGNLTQWLVTLLGKPEESTPILTMKLMIDFCHLSTGTIKACGVWETEVLSCQGKAWHFCDRSCNACMLLTCYHVSHQCLVEAVGKKKKKRIYTYIFHFGRIMTIFCTFIVGTDIVAFFLLSEWGRVQIISLIKFNDGSLRFFFLLFHLV